MERKMRKFLMMMIALGLAACAAAAPYHSPTAQDQYGGSSPAAAPSK
jgi:uncharacterized lipoprotein YmbA